MEGEMSSSPRPKIMVTNDDGIDAPGIRAIVQALVSTDLYDVLVCAPHTSVRHFLTCNRSKDALTILGFFQFLAQVGPLVRSSRPFAFQSLLQMDNAPNAPTSRLHRAIPAVQFLASEKGPRWAARIIRSGRFFRGDKSMEGHVGPTVQISEPRVLLVET